MQILEAVESVRGSEGQSEIVGDSGDSESTPLRGAKWGLEDNTAWYGQNKLSASIAICVASLRPSISHTTKASTIFENKVWELSSYKTVLWSFFIHISSLMAK